MSNITRLVETLINTKAHTATMFLSPNEVVKATRKLYKGKHKYHFLPKNQNIEIALTIGRPNYAEREFIEKCKLAKVPFPVKKIQLRFPPQLKQAA